MAKDYYHILGVNKSATPDEIKKAFRSLAHQHHPDKQGGNEAKFKEINEAYQILSDEKKRTQYDQFGSAAFDGSAGGGFGGGFSAGGGPASGWRNDRVRKKNVRFPPLRRLFRWRNKGGYHGRRYSDTYINYKFFGHKIRFIGPCGLSG